jgi:lysozyme
LQVLAGKVTKSIGGAATTQPQFDAMVLLAYNIGAGALAGSTLLRDHRAARNTAAAATFSDWRFQRGRVLPGLARRRAAEAARYRAAA